MKSSRDTAHLCALVLTLAALCSPRLAAGQQEPRVYDLTDADLTEEQLLDALKPASDPPPELMRPRGLNIAAPRAKCTRYHRPASRGLALANQPVTAAAAIKILFAFNSAELLPEAKSNLDALGKALASPLLATSCFRIEGHTDSIGSNAANDKLSEMRALAVVHYLTANFKLDPDRLMFAGYGKRRPIADNTTEAGRLKNRRVQVSNMGFGEAMP
jgi:OOP family OmpA-OmpF porin